MKKHLTTKIPIAKLGYLSSIIFILLAGVSFAGARPAVKSTKNLFAPPITVKGKVTDATTGETLIGVSVKIKETGEGVATDANGNYSISADGAATLVFSYIGYTAQEIMVNNKPTIDVKLAALNKALTEVVVVGYGTQKKISLTGAVDRVDASKAVEGRAVANTFQALQGESPNLIIQEKGNDPTNPDGNLNVNIRGTGTTGNNDPLVVIDGIIGGNINTLNPNDIDNISILKDAGSAAIYGSRSANGVILVTTKKGKLNSPPKVTYNGIYGVQTPKIQFHPVDAWVNAEDKNMSLENSGKPDQYTPEQIQAIKDKGNGDWRLETILHNAPQNNQNFSVSGGSANSTYLMSFGYLDQRSFLEQSNINGTYGLRRFNFRLNQTATLGNFNTSWNLTYAKVQTNAPYNDVIGDALRAPLTDSFQDAQGRYITGFVTDNPLDMLRNGGFNYNNNDEINGSFTVGYHVTPAFQIRAVFGGTVKSNSQLVRGVPLTYYPSGQSNTDASTADYNAKALSTNTNLLAEYTKTIGKHDINVLVGVANESYLFEASQFRQTLTDSLLGVPTSATQTDRTNSYNSVSNTQETSLNSIFGRLSYSYNNKYYLDASFRDDESSNFAAGHRWAFFPSVGLSWRATEEDFMKDYKDQVGDLRVHGNYGILGNQSVGPYQYITTYGVNTGTAYAFNNSSVVGYTQTLANPGITWESAATLDLGLNASFFKGHFLVDADYFNKTTSNILAPRQDVPSLFGSTLPTYNISKVQDKGWEVKLTYNTRGELFSHSVTFSLSNATSKLLAYSFDQSENVFQREEFEFVRRVGLPITVYQGYKTNGLYQTTADVASYPHFANYPTGLAPGDWKFVDKNHDGVIDANDKFILGDPFPHYTFGLNYNVTFKNFDATVFIQGVLKRQELIRGELIEPYHFTTYGGTVYDSSSDFWTPTNTGAKYPRLAENGSVPNNNNFRTGSDMYLFNTAYGRLKNIQVGYSFPAAMLKKVSISRARIYFTAQNLLTISPLKFTDPEGTEFGNNLDNTVGADTPRGYPLAKFYGVGVDLTF
ncbi:TonB-dependent receptor [Mucilaginibacter sp. dw_454]|uniref:SusC/RagA family TonB-linked outer membrane protein n=1 Tax=Mucilaginibacter sp. dw_454 TaxID=2720079 RepID=UPI001BD61E91|nr:TonB-dependent receptor [Mucilaginibacter sp. dw_454]